MTKKLPESKTTDDYAETPKPKSYEHVIARWTVVLGISTVMLVIATGVSAYFLFITDHTLKETLAETARSAKAAEKAANISADTARRQLRAYIDITDVHFDCPNCIKTKNGIVPPKKGHADFRMLMKIKNFGSTPAYEVKACSRTYMTERDAFPPDDFDYSCDEICKTCPPATIGPGSEVPIVLPLELGDVFMSSFGLKRMFYFGTINFKDTFGKDRKHPFCWFFQGDDQGDAFGCPKNNTDNDD